MNYFQYGSKGNKKFIRKIQNSGLSLSNKIPQKNFPNDKKVLSIQRKIQKSAILQAHIVEILNAGKHEAKLRNKIEICIINDELNPSDSKCLHGMLKHSAIVGQTLDAFFHIKYEFN